MNSKFFIQNTYGNIQTNPYLRPPSVGYQKQIITDATMVSSFMNKTENDFNSFSQTSRINMRSIQNILSDTHSKQNNYVDRVVEYNPLPVRYQSPSHKFQNNLVIQPLNFLNSTVRLSKNQYHSKSGINLLSSISSKQNKNQNLKCNSSYKRNQIKDIQHLSAKKCTLNDNRCMGYNFQNQKANQVTLCYKGHIKKTYL